jgi:fatty-acyl-CoA synthase
MGRDDLSELSFEPLTPTSFLERSSLVFGRRTAAADGERRFTYEELWDRARRLAGALVHRGVANGERAAVLAPNSHVLLEAHYGIPLAGAVLLALNTRLAPRELAYVLEHSGSSLLIYDHELEPKVKEITRLVPSGLKLICAGEHEDEYEDMLEVADHYVAPVSDERALLSLNYTSGTTGKPKGVMYHHRGAYLQALAMAYHAGLDAGSVFLWTLPMFHCNGWCFPWAVTAAGGVHVCLRTLDPPVVWRLIREEDVTHLNAAPTVLIALAQDPAAQEPARRKITVCTGGAPPSPALLERLAQLNMEVTHLYGLTETFGPIVVCDWHPEWSTLEPQQQATLKARQGVGNIIAQSLRVVDEHGRDVPSDAQTIGEIAVRGNDLMLGYYRDEAATRNAAPDGWFRSGDLVVMHPDGYVELRDRAKDIIISGGENIASVEVEQAISSHPAVLEAAVVAMAHDRWGEVPAAFVALEEGASVSEQEIIEHVRGRIAHFKAPKRVRFGPLPKTSTGKVQKYLLRERVAGNDEPAEAGVSPPE